MNLPGISSKEINKFFNESNDVDRHLIRLSYKTFLSYGRRDSKGADQNFARAYAKCVLYMIWSDNKKSKRIIKKLVSDHLDKDASSHKFALQYATIITGVPIEEKLRNQNVYD